MIVCHKNKEMREHLKNHEKDPKYFLELKEPYAANNITAKRWLAQVIDDYRFYFNNGRVKFVFE